MSVRTIDPATGEPVATHEETGAAELEGMLDLARERAVRWAAVPPERRAESLRDLAAALRSDAGALAALATREMGKPLAESRAEVEKCAVACNWFADHAPDLLRPEEVSTGAMRTRLAYQPLGVILAIMPWNFPYWQVIRALAPALAAGNVVMLKHAPSTTGCALELAATVLRAGLPEGLCSAIVVNAERTDGVESSVIADRRTTCLPKYMERGGFLLTAWRLGRYYRTYPAYVEDEPGERSGLGRSQPLPEHRSIVHRGEADHRRAGGRGRVQRASASASP